MPHAVSPDLAAWSNFYVIVGSSAAALTGLMFVVITLVSRSPTTREGTATFSTPTVVHFGSALLLGAILAAPWPSLRHLGIVLAIVGLCGMIYALRVTLRTQRLTTYRPDVDDWVWYAILPVLAYLTVAACAILAFVAPAGALYGFAAAALLLIFIGIRNAWDVVTFVAFMADEPSATNANEDNDSR